MVSGLQFDNPKKQQPCDIVIGLDFGTSCTKVVIRSPHRSNSRAFAVPWGNAAHKSSPYLLPSTLWVSEDKKASLVRTSGAKQYRDIKHRLMRSEKITPIDGGSESELYPIAISFLALVLREAREWFLSTHKGAYYDFFLEWQVNLGLPSADFDNPELCYDYLNILAAAWRLSVVGRDITLDGAEAAYYDSTFTRHEDRKIVSAAVMCGQENPVDVSLVPEVVAEVVGYARSDLRRTGLHLLVDVGASTLDICGFNLHQKEQEDRYELLTADVRPLGVLGLHRQRLDSLQQSANRHFTQLRQKHDPVEPIPDSLGMYMPTHDEWHKKLVRGDEQYLTVCKSMLWQCLVDLKTRRYPGSPCWNDEIPLFLTGGARSMPFYSRLIELISEGLPQRYSTCRGIRTMSLAKPLNFEADGLSDAAYNRLAVAWGLSYESFNIGEVSRPSEIDDVAAPERRASTQQEISKDVV